MTPKLVLITKMNTCFAPVFPHIRNHDQKKSPNESDFVYLKIHYIFLQNRCLKPVNSCLMLVISTSYKKNAFIVENI